MNLFAFVSNPSVVCRLVSEPSGTISFSLSKQLRKWALLLMEGDGKTMHKYQDGKFVDRLKLHKRCCCCWVRRQNCIFRAQNKHSLGSCRCVCDEHPSIVPVSVLKSEENFRLNYLSIIELHLVGGATGVCRCHACSEEICITISKVSYHKLYGIEMCARCSGAEDALSTYRRQAA